MMECFEAGDWNIPSGHIVLYEAGLLLSKDISAVLDKFYITKNKKQLHEDLITAGIAFQHRWQEWLDRSTLETFRYYPASKLFHEQLLRWYKGAIKTYRIWLIDLAK
jgi:hypothetical protein